MSNIQLPDYPWEHPQESDYEEARAMSKPALTDKADLHAWLMKASRVIYVATDKTTADNISDGLLKAAARIAELEFQRDSQKNRADANEKSWLEHAARVAELEAELSAQQQTAANLAAYTDRIAELEAGWDKWHGDAVTQMRLRVEAEAERDVLKVEKKLAVDAGAMVLDEYEKLKAERDKLTIENVDLAISTGKRRAELEAELEGVTARWQDCYDSRKTEIEQHEKSKSEIARLTASLAAQQDGPADGLDVKAAVLAERKAIKEGLEYRFNEHLCEMKPDYDDSITGFNEAWEVMSNYFRARHAP